MTEEQILLRVVREGDRAAFEVLVDEHRAGAVAYAERILQDRFAAEEAVQDAFAEFYFRRNEFRGESAFKTYFYAIIRHKCIDQMRRRRAESEVLEDTAVIPSPEEDYVKQESCEEAFRLMRTLPAQQLDALWRYAVQGMSYREIAAATGRSETQVRVDVFRARRRLRQMRRDQYES